MSGTLLNFLNGASNQKVQQISIAFEVPNRPDFLLIWNPTQNNIFSNSSASQIDHVYESTMHQWTKSLDTARIVQKIKYSK